MFPINDQDYGGSSRSNLPPPHSHNEAERFLTAPQPVLKIARSAGPQLIGHSRSERPLVSMYLSLALSATSRTLYAGE